MFGIFKSNYARAVTATGEFIAIMVSPLGKLPGSVLRDPYCLGFLQIVGLHIAGQILKGLSSDKRPAAFADALKMIAPAHLASEAVEWLSFIEFGTLPSDADYFRGKKDGDAFMAYKLLHLVPQREGEAALERFFDRARQVASPTPPQQTREPTPPLPQPLLQAIAPAAPDNISDEYRTWVTMESSTMDVMRGFLDSSDLFSMFAGAVFALHQDTLLMYSIDMLKTDDVILNMSLDKIRPNRLGDFPTRLGLVMAALYDIDNANLDIVEKRVPGLSEADQFAKTVMATMRSQAARVWLMTMNSKVKKSEASKIRPSVTTMWALLQKVPGKTAAKEALNFTGNYYKGLWSDNMNPGAWEQTPTLGAELSPNIAANDAPPQYCTIWLDGDEIWLSSRSKDVSINKRSYRIPGGAFCFPKDKNGHEALLKILRTQRDLWAPGNEAALIRRAEVSQNKD